MFIRQKVIPYIFQVKVLLQLVNCLSFLGVGSSPIVFVLPEFILILNDDIFSSRSWLSKEIKFTQFKCRDGTVVDLRQTFLQLEDLHETLDWALTN